MSLQDTLSKLYQRNRHGMHLELGSMLSSLKERGNPEEELRVIHIAGVEWQGQRSCDASVCFATCRVSNRYVYVSASSSL